MNSSGTSQQPLAAIQPKLTNDVVPPKPEAAPQQPVSATAIPVVPEKDNEPGMFPIGAEHSPVQSVLSTQQKAAPQSQAIPSQAPKSEPKKTSGKHWLVISMAIIVSAVLVVFAVIAFKQGS